MQHDSPRPPAPLSLSFSPSPPPSLPPITTNRLGAESLSGTFSACSDQRGFLCASRRDSSSEGIDSWASIFESAEKLSKAAASSLCLDLWLSLGSNSSAVCLLPPLREKNYPGVGGDAGTTKAELEAAPWRKRRQDNAPWDKNPASAQPPPPSRGARLPPCVLHIVMI